MMKYYGYLSELSRELSEFLMWKLRGKNFLQNEMEGEWVNSLIT